MSWVDGRTVVITGGTSGIGKAAAFAVVAAGGRVVLAGRTERRVAESVAQVRESGGEALGVPTDVGDPDAVDRLMAAAVEEFGSLDGLVTAAGIGRIGSALTQPLADIEQTVRTDLLGTIYCVRSAAERMGPGSQIVTVSSATDAGHMATLATSGSSDPGGAPSATMAVYAAVKTAVAMLSNSVRPELASRGIRLSCLLPGGVATHFQDSWGPSELQAVGMDSGEDGGVDYQPLDLSTVMRARDVAPSVLYAFDLPPQSKGANLEIV